MSVEINTDYSQLNNGKMNLQKLIDKYESRNKGRMGRIKESSNHKIKCLLLTLHVETEDFIQDLKRLYKN